MEITDVFELLWWKDITWKT